MPPKKQLKPKAVPRRRAPASAATDEKPAEENPPPAEEPASATQTGKNGDAAEAQEAAPTDNHADEATNTSTSVIAPPKGRLGSLQPGAKRGAPLKFKPKFVGRRSKEEREALEAKFEHRPSPAPASRGSRGGRGRGRGRGGFGDTPGIASGPFALGSVISGRQRVERERLADDPSRKSKKRSFGSLKAKVKSEGGATGPGPAIKDEYISSDESEGDKLDIEYIHLADDEEEEEAGEGEQKHTPAVERWGTGAPVRIARHEHVDRHTIVNTDSSNKVTAKAAKKAKEKEMTFEAEISIKDEPQDDDTDVDMAEVMPAPVSPERKRSERRRSSTHKKKPVITTAEEQAEYDREQEDRRVILEQLGGLKIEKDADGDVPMKAESAAAAEENPDIEGQMFFFQLPRVLPRLVPTVPAVKSEAKKEEDVGNGIIKEAKPEASAAPKPKPKLNLREKIAEAEALPPSGRAGKLQIHKSGRMSMLWGTGDDAFEMEVTRGAEAEFLQEVVVMKSSSPWGDEDKDENGRKKGVVYSLGQVKGKYIVAPDFVKLTKRIADDEKSKAKGKKKADEEIEIL